MRQFSLKSGCPQAKSLIQEKEKLDWKIKFEKSGIRMHVNNTIWPKGKEQTFGLIEILEASFKKLRVEELKVPLLVTFMNCLTLKWQH